MIVLDFFAWWCGPCRSSSPIVERDIYQYFKAQGGNDHGVPVTVIAVNIESDSPDRTDQFVEEAGLELVGDDFSREAWNQFNEERVVPIKKYAVRNPSLIVGLALLFGMLFLVGIGHLIWDTEMFRPLSTPTRLPPTAEHPFGTDTQGRDLLAIAILGTPLTLRIGLIAGIVAISLGTVAAFLSAYYRGVIDGAIRSVVDVGLAMPALLILILVRINVGRELSTDEMGIAIGLTSWVFPARTIRSQVLVMREQAYVELSRLSGTSGMGIIFKEMMPNLIPYITASLVAVSYTHLTLPKNREV